MKELIKNFIDKITEKRPIERLRQEYGRYTSRCRYVEYSDRQQEYGEPTEVLETKEVHSKNALVEFIKEEFKRRDNSTGKFATIQLGLNEGIFIANDDFLEGKCSYKRLKSEQLSQIERYNNQILDQEELIEMILRLKPSLNDYDEKFIDVEDDNGGDFGYSYYQKVFAVYSKLKINRNATMNSTPVYGADGTADNSYTCTFRLTSGVNAGTDEEVVIPEGFRVSCPFVKAGKYYCTFDIDVQPLFNPNGNITFKVKVPNYETEIENAIINEAETLKEDLKEFSELLVLADL